MYVCAYIPHDHSGEMHRWHVMWAYTTCRTYTFTTCHLRVHRHTNDTSESAAIPMIPMIRLDVCMPCVLTCHRAMPIHLMPINLMPINLMPINSWFGQGRAAFAHSITLALMQNVYIGTHTEYIYSYRYRYVYIYTALCVVYKDAVSAVWL